MENNFIDNRSEIVFVYDAEKTNPNGNPMSSDNSPRIDRQTGHAVVTDVRLKRYLRDQLDEDGESIYIQNTGNNDTRSELLSTIFDVDKVKELLKDDDQDEEHVKNEIHRMLTDNAIDIRLFGSTLSVDGEDSELMDVLSDISHLEGPVQFTPALSLNAPVQQNDEYDSLTSVISNNDESQGGGYGLDDKRLRYAVFPFHAVVNENAARETRLTESDVEKLDTLCWRSIKNQTITRSKIGQEPRMYVRVEYTENEYHIGDLHNTLQFGEETPEPEKLRTGYDVCLDLSEFIDRLDNEQEKIETVYVVGSDTFDYKVDTEVGDFDHVIESLNTRLENTEVQEIDI